MKLVAISIVSLAAGLVAYLATVRGFWGQGIGSGDLRAVMFWSALPATVAITTAYAPTCLRCESAPSATNGLLGGIPDQRNLPAGLPRVWA